MSSACASRVGPIDECCEAESHVRCCLLFNHCCRWLSSVGDEALKAIAATNHGIQHLDIGYDVSSSYPSWVTWMYVLMLPRHVLFVH